MEKFKKRRYHRPGEFWQDNKYIWRNRKIIRQMGREISPDFRERLMLVVTAVNSCRYCSYYHARLALKSGLTGEEIEQLLNGVVQNCPEEELPALLFAQEWAESGAKPEPEAWEQLVKTYGQDKARQIEMALRMIQVGNLSGNTLDYFLFILSGGRLGNQEKKGTLN